MNEMHKLKVLLFWKRVENETDKNKLLKIRTAIGSLIFSLIVFGEEIYYDKTFHISGFIWAIYGAIAFAFMFYFYANL